MQHNQIQPFIPGHVRRNSVPQACVACRKAHASCSLERPCRRCAARNVACVDDPPLIDGAASPANATPTSTGVPPNTNTNISTYSSTPGYNSSAVMQNSSSPWIVNSIAQHTLSQSLSAIPSPTEPDPVIVVRFPSVMQHISDFSARELIAQAEEQLRVLHRAYSLFASNFPSSSSSSSSTSPFSVLVDFPVPGDYNAPALESPAIRMDLQFLSSTSAWHSLSSLAGAGILIWSGDGMCLYASPLVCQWTGVGASLLSSRVAAVMEHVPQGNVELFYRRYYALAADPRVLMYRSVSVVYKSGPGWICSTALFLRDALGRPKYTVCLQVPVDHLWPAELGRGEDVIYLTSSAASGDRL